MSLGDGELVVVNGQQLRIPFASVERAQIGLYSSGKRPSHSACLWLEGEAEPLEIRPYRGHPAYGDAMRALAAAVAGRRGIGSVIGGMPFSRSLVALLLMTAAGVAISVQIALLFRLGSWAYVVLPVLAAAVMVPVYREALNARPRRINSAHELEPFLPRSSPKA